MSKASNGWLFIGISCIFCIGSFFKFALSKKRSYFWAHNAQGYDSRLLFSYISHQSTLYKASNIIMRGEKILQFCIKTPKFRDSMCHLATSLDCLPKILGFNVLSKALEVYDTLMKELNDGISPLTNITLASYALTVFRSLYMPKDTLVVAAEEGQKIAQKALHGGITDVRIL